MIFSTPSATERTAQICRAAARFCALRGWAPVHEMPLPNGRRADMMAIDPAGLITIVEIKVSRADLMGDCKWIEYLGYCDRFFWAVPARFNLTPFEEPGFQPQLCGLIVADRYDAAVVRDAPLRKLPPARRKAETLRFARRAARRLVGDLDPGLAGFA